MMRDDFIEQKDIAYFDHIHKKEGWHLHKNSTAPLHLFAFNHPNDVF
jgi:hypothetical protein